MADSDDVRLSILMDENSVAQLERAALAMERAALAMEKSSGAARNSTAQYGATGGTAGDSNPSQGATRPTAAERMSDGMRWMENRFSDSGPTGQFFAPISRAMGNFGNSLDKLNDSTLTTTSRMGAFVETLPVIGQFTRGLREAISGLAGLSDRLRTQSQIAETAASINQGVRTSFDFQGGLEVERAIRSGRAGMAGAMAGRGFAGLGVDDPANLYDPFQATAFTRQISIAQQSQLVQLGIGDATSRVTALDEQIRRAEQNRRLAEDRVRGSQAMDSRARAGVSWMGYLSGSDKGDIDKSSRELLNNRQDLIAWEEKIRDLTRQRQEAGIDLERKRGEELQLNVTREQERLRVLQEQEGLVRAQTQAFGAMYPGQRQMAVNFLRQAKEKGSDTLTPFMLTFLRNAGAGQWVAREFERRGEKDPLNKEFQQLQGPEGNMPQTLGENLAAQRQAQKNLAELSMKIEASTTEAFSREFEKFVKTLISQMTAIVKKQSDLIGDRQQISNNVRGN